MNLYLVERADRRIIYDAADAFVVSATDEKDALLVTNECGWGDAGQQDSANVKAVGESSVPRGLVLMSFNAG